MLTSTPHNNHHHQKQTKTPRQDKITIHLPTGCSTTGPADIQPTPSRTDSTPKHISPIIHLAIPTNDQMIYLTTDGTDPVTS